MASETGLLGTWKMLSWTRMTVATGEVKDALGPDPIGYIAFHADGRMKAYVHAAIGQYPRRFPRQRKRLNCLTPCSRTLRLTNSKTIE